MLPKKLDAETVWQLTNPRVWQDQPSTLHQLARQYRCLYVRMADGDWWRKPAEKLLAMLAQFPGYWIGVPSRLGTMCFFERLDSMPGVLAEQLGPHLAGALAATARVAA